MELTLDRLSVKPSTKREYTPEGFLIIRDNRLARTGTVTYRAGEIRIVEPENQILRGSMDPVVAYRPPELFTLDVLQSFENKPFVNKHPKQAVNVINVKGERVGHAFNIRMDGDYMMGDIQVEDSATITEIENGSKRELSLGYMSIFEGRPGIAPDGTPYDVIQTKMLGNHVALVNTGRCGSECRVSDAAGITPDNRGTIMDLVTLKFRGVPYDMTQQVADLFKGVQTELVAATEAQTSLTTDHASAIESTKADYQAKLDKLTGELEVLKTQIVTDYDLDQRAAERAKLCTDAATLVGDSASFDGKSNSQVRREAVKAGYKGDIDLDSASEGMVEGLFLGLLANTKNAYQRLGEKRAEHLACDAKTEPVVDPVAAARQKKLDENKERASKMRNGAV